MADGADDPGDAGLLTAIRAFREAGEAARPIRATTLNRQLREGARVPGVDRETLAAVVDLAREAARRRVARSGTSMTPPIQPWESVYQAATRFLYDKTSRAVGAFLMGWCRFHEDRRDDVLQEAYGRFFASLASGPEGGTEDPEAYVQTIARNVIISAWRKDQGGRKKPGRKAADDREPETDDAEPDPPVDGWRPAIRTSKPLRHDSETHDAVARAEARRLAVGDVGRWLATFNERQFRDLRDPFVLRHASDPGSERTIEEIAGLLGRSEPGIRTELRCWHQRIRELRARYELDREDIRHLVLEVVRRLEDGGWPG